MAYEQREQFNWADDVEDKIQLVSEQARESVHLLCREYFDWAEDVENEILSKSTQETNLSTSQPVLSEEPYESDNSTWSEDSTWSEESDDSSNSDNNRTDASLDALSCFQTNCDTPLINGEAEGYDIFRDEALDSLALMQASVDNEFTFRDYFMDAENTELNVHHFNWMGCPVYQHSATPPAVSLVFLLADPKSPRPSDEFRMQAILGCAATFIDPVIVHTDHMGEELFRFSGSELEQAAAGRVLKYYTPHGQWVKDPREENGETTLDDGNFNDYVSPGLAIGNGLVDTSLIPSRARWKQCQEEYFARSRVFSNRNLLGWRPKPSPLRASTSIADVNTEGATAKAPPSTTFDEILRDVSRLAENPDVLPAIKKRDVQNEETVQSFSSNTSQSKSAKKRQVPMLNSTIRRPAAVSAAEQLPVDPSRNPNIYFSFPTPEFDKAKKKLKPLKLSSAKRLSPKNFLKRALGGIFVSSFGSLDLNQIQP